MHDLIQSFIKESRQFQLRAVKEDGEEDCSKWYDEEDTVYEMKKEIDELDEYESTYVIKRIAEMNDEEEDEEATLESKCELSPEEKEESTKTKKSKHTKKYEKMFGEANQLNEKIKAVETKAKETGISYNILKQVYDRGMGAWKQSHRPGTTPQQWALARINSFVTGGKTQKTADADLWAKVDKGSVKKESTNINEERDYGEEQIKMALAQLNHIDEYARKTYELVKTQQGLEAWVASKITKVDDYMESVYHWLEYTNVYANDHWPKDMSDFKKEE